jgi:flagellar hook assembly protein FlgD
MKTTIMAFIVFIFWSSVLVAQPPSGIKGETAMKPPRSAGELESPPGQISSSRGQTVASQNPISDDMKIGDAETSEADSAAERKSSGPVSLELSQNYPNPFNSETEIKYGLPERSSVYISVYNILGKKVRTIKDGIEDSGYYSVNWDGRDDNGDLLASGMYFYVFASDDNYLTRKMMFLK